MSLPTLSPPQSELSSPGSPDIRLPNVPNVWLRPTRRSAVVPNKSELPTRPCSATEQVLIRPAGNRSPLYRFLKRVGDIVGALLLLVLLSPILITTFLVLCLTTKGRPFFVQDRVGFCGQRFRIFKFRTMVLQAEALQKLVPNQQNGPIFKNSSDPRVTRIGRFLRSTSIDETPQLINVILGQMSLVGPRPHPVSEVADYEPWQLERLSIKPGLTCLWQVEGRSELEVVRGMQMDIWYVRHQGILTDLQLLVRTPWSVLTGRGAY